jgi:hypothetical protein
VQVAQAEVYLMVPLVELLFTEWFLQVAVQVVRELVLHLLEL